MKQGKRIAAIVVFLGAVALCVLVGINAYQENHQNQKKTASIGNQEKQITIESDISMEDSQVTMCRQIDAQLSEELKSGNYTLEEPLVVQNPYQNSPLTALVLFTTEDEVSVKATVKGDESFEDSDFAGETEAGTDHRVPVLGLYAGRTNQVLIELFNENGKQVDERTLEIQTDPLPEKMEDLVDIYQSGEDTALPLILVTGQQTTHSFAFDKSGEIRWYLSDTSGSYGIFPISGGRFMFQDRDTMTPTYEKPHTTKMYEMDYLGRVHKVYYLENGWHHEVIEKEPGGNLLILSSSIDEHVEDVVLEMDRKTGQVVKKLDMREIFGETYVDMIDWAHLNTVDYDAEDNALILSPRNLHSVIKVDWNTNELIWILANPEFWEGTDFEDKVLEPEGEIVWHYQQHASYRIGDTDADPNTIQVMLYDNHWHKTRKVDFFDDDSQSYVTQYTIDEKNKTVKQDKIYGGVKSKITSNFVLEQEENRVFSMGGYLDPEIDGHKGMIYEFTYDTGDVVNQYALKNTFYRAYAFEPDYAALEEQMEQSEIWNYGSLKDFEKMNGQIEIIEKALEDSLDMKITDQILYIKAKDHDIRTIYLIGENNKYELDFSDTLPGEDLYENVSYYLTAPLTSLEEDNYELVLNYNDDIISTGKTIQIKEVQE